MGERSRCFQSREPSFRPRMEVFLQPRFHMANLSAWDGPRRFGKTERMPPPGIYAGVQVCTTTTLMPLASPGLKSPRKGLDKSPDTLNTSELWHLFYYAHHTTTDSRITMLHGSPGSQLLTSYFQKCFPSLPMGKRDQPKHRSRRWEGEGL